MHSKYKLARPKGSRLLIGLVIAALIIMLLIAGIHWYVQHLVYMPHIKWRPPISNERLAYEDVYFNTSDGQKISGWYFPVKNANLTVLFCHGNGGNMTYYTSTAQMLNDCGKNVLLFDYRGYGKSTGTPSEKGTYLDAHAAWDWLLTNKHAQPDRIVVFGRSLGGSIAAELASDVNCAGLWIESTFTTMEDEGATRFPRWLVKLTCSYKYPTIDYIKKVHCPVLIVHSPEDNWVPYRFGEELYAAANEPKTFLKISGNHYRGFQTSGTAYSTPVCEWLNKL